MGRGPDREPLRNPAGYARGGGITARREKLAIGVFDSWPQIERRLRGAGHWLLVLDFDGTLVPVVDQPDGVRLDPLVHRVLSCLARHRGAHVYIMSGRRLADLRRHTGIPGVHLLGLHGWERRGATLPAAQKSLLRQAKLWLLERLPPLPGIAVEDKVCALAVHYRGAKPPAARLAGQALVAARDHFRPSLRLLKGRKIWELLPRAIAGKGRATQALLRRLPAGTLPIFVGDDTSDESAFAVLRHGLSIHVGGPTDTQAPFCLRDPAEVREFLERLEEVISRRESGS